MNKPEELKRYEPLIEDLMQKARERGVGRITTTVSRIDIEDTLKAASAKTGIDVPEDEIQAVIEEAGQRLDQYVNKVLPPLQGPSFAEHVRRRVAESEGKSS